MKRKKGDMKKNQKKNQQKNQKKKKLEKIKDDFYLYIKNDSKGINYDLFKDYFDFVVPSALAKQLYETKDKKETIS